MQFHRTLTLVVVLTSVVLPWRAEAQHAGRGAAGARALTPPPEATQFDFLVGQWDLTVTPKVSGLAARIHGAPKLVGTWTATRAFDGWGVQDELRILDRSGNPSSLTSTMRFYDQAAGHWTQSSLDVYRGRFGTATASFSNGAMTVLSRGTDAEGRPVLVRSRFQAITPTGFRVQQDRSLDDGRTWDEAVLRIDAKRSSTPPR